MNLGEKLKILRKQAGLTLQQVGDAFNISRSSVAGWESNASKPDIDRLPTLARLYGVTIDEMLSDRPPSAGAKLRSVPSPANDSNEVPTADEMLALFNDYRTASPKDREFVRSSASTAAQRELRRRAAGDKGQGGAS